MIFNLKNDDLDKYKYLKEAHLIKNFLYSSRHPKFTYRLDLEQKNQ
ncbi:hypothetical protein ACEW7V_01630 [Areca yellow leaf disease phytoplasma]